MFFTLFSGNEILKFVNQLHFTFGLKGWQQKRAAAIVIQNTEWVESILNWRLLLLLSGFQLYPY